MAQSSADCSLVILVYAFHVFFRTVTLSWTRFNVQQPYSWRSGNGYDAMCRAILLPVGSYQNWTLFGLVLESKMWGSHSDEDVSVGLLTCDVLEVITNVSEEHIITIFRVEWSEDGRDMFLWNVGNPYKTTGSTIPLLAVLEQCPAEMGNVK